MTAPEPPPRPLSDAPEELGFHRRTMVRWFDPVQLAGTGIQVGVSSVFGSYSDKREIQAALAPAAEPHREHADDEELWFDYVADLGDGFEATYTVAHFLARPALRLEREGGAWDTERGRILVMGGDQVYPTATRTEYENRLVGPYRAALPFVYPDPPRVYAIPGNHDWYDGLTNFMRIFCRNQWIGAWQSTQERSYFAVQLPHRWWLWAIDIQFDTYIDEPQLAYFRRARSLLVEGDRLILATGKPSWTDSMKPHPEPSYANLAYFEDELLKGTKARLGRRRQRGQAPLRPLRGRLRHAAPDHVGGRRRLPLPYAPPRGGHRARGGSQGDETDRLVPAAGRVPARPRLQPAQVGGTMAAAASRTAAWSASSPCSTWRLRCCFSCPSGATSRTTWPRRRARPRLGRRLEHVGDLRCHGRCAAVRPVRRGAPRVVARAGGGGAYRSARARAGAQVAVSAWLWVGVLDLPAWTIAIAALAGVLTAPFGAALLGLYLALADLAVSLLGERLAGLDRHANEVFSCQGIEDWKSFLRFHVAPDGRLTIYPIGIERVARPREVRFNRTDEPGAPYFTIPEEVRAQLIEDPVVCE